MTSRWWRISSGDVWDRSYLYPRLKGTVFLHQSPKIYESCDGSWGRVHNDFKAPSQEAFFLGNTSVI
jgi:hypothetical protein